MWRCPACGHGMARLETDPETAYEDAVDRYMSHMNAMEAWEQASFEGEPPEGFDADAGLAGWPEKSDFDYSDHLECQNQKCPLQGTYFNMHHPFRGHYSSRGDSFSLSSIEEGRGGQPLPPLGAVHCPSCGDPMQVKDNEGHCYKEDCTMRSPCYWGVTLETGETLTIDWVK